jgi:hypothetical protein
LQFTAETFIWQKEAAINLAVRALPRSCTAVVWTDTDLIWNSDSWPISLPVALSEHVLIQPFSHCIRLPRNLEENCVPSAEYEQAIMHERQDGFAAWHRKFAPSGKIGHQRGHVGFAWAAPRQLIEEVGLYPYCVLGGGDAIAAYASLGGMPRGRIIRSAGLRYSIEMWQRKWFAAVQRSIGYLDGTVFHLWHGEIETRKYRERHILLDSLNFNPEHDVHLESNGLLAWSRPELREHAKQYFSSRSED